MSLAAELKDFASVYAAVRGADRPYSRRPAAKPVAPADAAAAAASNTAQNESPWHLGAIPDGSSVTPQGNTDERDLKIRTVYGEAGAEPPEGQAGVLGVINNRVASGQWGKTARDVILAPKQFSMWNPGDPAGEKARMLDPNSDDYKRIGDMVDRFDRREIADPTGGATHYYNPHVVSPEWADPLAAQNDRTIGNHRFVGGPKQRTAAIPAYAAGGLVEDDNDVVEPDSDEDDYDNTRAIPAAYSGADYAPAASPASAGGDLLDGIGEAIGHGLKYLQEAFGMNAAAQGAIPDSAGPAEGVRRFLSGEGAATPAEMKAIGKIVDPKSELTDGLRAAAGMNAAYRTYLAMGEPQKAAKLAQAIVQHQRALSAQYGDQAEQLLRRGDIAGGVAALEKGQESIPDGTSVQTRINQDGTVDYVHRGPRGETLHQARATPQQLLAAAIGLKDGSAYWSELVRAASGKYQEEQPQEDPAFNQYVGGLAEGEAKRGAIPTEAAPQQAAVSPGRGPITQEGNAPQGAIPTPEQAPAQPEAERMRFVNSALQNFAKENPEPQLPPRETLLQMRPENQRRVQSNYMAEHKQWTQARNSIAQQANASFNDQMKQRAEEQKAARAQDAIPKVVDRTNTAAAIQGSMEQFKSTLPEGQTFAPVDERAISTAATHLFDSNNIAPNDAVDAAMDLTDPNNKTLDGVKFEGTQPARVPLQNGTEVMLNRQAYGVLKTLRAKKLKDAADKAEADKNAFVPRAGRALMTIGENSAITRTAPFAKLAGEVLQGWLNDQWQDYQKSKGAPGG